MYTFTNLRMDQKRRVVVRVVSNISDFFQTLNVFLSHLFVNVSCHVRRLKKNNNNAL